MYDKNSTSEVGRRLKSHMRGAGVADDRDDHQTKHNQAARDHSISEERGIMDLTLSDMCHCLFPNCTEGEQSMHDSLEELADLLGDEELPNEMEKGLPQREGKKDSASKAKSKLPNQKHRAGIICMDVHHIFVLSHFGVPYFLTKYFVANREWSCSRPVSSRIRQRGARET